eukprot:gene2640-1638_t
MQYIQLSVSRPNPPHHPIFRASTKFTHALPYKVSAYHSLSHETAYIPTNQAEKPQKLHVKLLLQQNALKQHGQESKPGKHTKKAQMCHKTQIKQTPTISQIPNPLANPRSHLTNINNLKQLTQTHPPENCNLPKYPPTPKANIQSSPQTPPPQARSSYRPCAQTRTPESSQNQLKYTTRNSIEIHINPNAQSPAKPLHPYTIGPSEHLNPKDRKYVYAVTLKAETLNVPTLPTLKVPAKRPQRNHIVTRHTPKHLYALQQISNIHQTSINHRLQSSHPPNKLARTHLQQTQIPASTHQTQHASAICPVSASPLTLIRLPVSTTIQFLNSNNPPPVSRSACQHNCNKAPKPSQTSKTCNHNPSTVSHHIKKQAIKPSSPATNKFCKTATPRLEHSRNKQRNCTRNALTKLQLQSCPYSIYQTQNTFDQQYTIHNSHNQTTKVNLNTNNPNATNNKHLQESKLTTSNTLGENTATHKPQTTCTYKHEVTHTMKRSPAKQILGGCKSNTNNKQCTTIHRANNETPGFPVSSNINHKHETVKTAHNESYHHSTQNLTATLTITNNKLSQALTHNTHHSSKAISSSPASKRSSERNKNNKLTQDHKSSNRTNKECQPKHTQIVKINTNTQHSTPSKIKTHATVKHKVHTITTTKQNHHAATIVVTGRQRESSDHQQSSKQTP